MPFFITNSSHQFYSFNSERKIRGSIREKILDHILYRSAIQNTIESICTHPVKLRQNNLFLKRTCEKDFCGNIHHIAEDRKMISFVKGKKRFFLESETSPWIWGTSFFADRNLIQAKSKCRYIPVNTGNFFVRNTSPTIADIHRSDSSRR